MGINARGWVPVCAVFGDMSVTAYAEAAYEAILSSDEPEKTTKQYIEIS